MPAVTLGLMGLLAAIFLAQVAGARGDGGFDDLIVFDLMRFGALNPDLVSAGGDWWRLTTAPLLHGGITHLLLNGVALFFGGKFIEQHMGGFTLAGFLSAGSVAGALMSYALGDPGMVSVGASGGIMALLAGSLLLCFTLPEDADTVSGKWLFPRILVPSLIPSHGGVDYAANFGGAVAGAGIAACLYAISEPVRDPPLRRVIALAAAAVYAGAALLGASRLIEGASPVDVAATVVIPSSRDPLPALPEPAARAQVASRPADPGMRWELALALTDRGDTGGAAREAETALRQIRTYGSRRYDDFVVPQLKIFIARAWAGAGYPAWARLLARDACPGLTAGFRDRVETRGICG